MEKNYAIIENGKVVNVIVATPEYAAQHSYILLPDGFGIGSSFDGITWNRPPAPDPQIVSATRAAYERKVRDTLLKETDWTQSVDISGDVKALWAPYRQALRDVPTQSGFPFNIAWPTPPKPFYSVLLDREIA
jgi:hypothetical protein